MRRLLHTICHQIAWAEKHQRGQIDSGRRGMWALWFSHQIVKISGSSHSWENRRFRVKNYQQKVKAKSAASWCCSFVVQCGVSFFQLSPTQILRWTSRCDTRKASKTKPDKAHSTWSTPNFTIFMGAINHQNTGMVYYWLSAYMGPVVHYPSRSPEVDNKLILVFMRKVRISRDFCPERPWASFP